jgi:hypothetical protein
MKKLIVLLAVVALAATQSANATPTVTIADNNGNSASASDASGTVTYSGVLGNWNINVDTGIGGPPAPNGGTAAHPSLDLGGQNNFSQTATGPLVGNVLTITFTDDNLGPISEVLAQIVTGFKINNMTAVFHLLVNNVVVTTINGFSGIQNANINVGSNSTVSLQAILTATDKTAFTSFDTGTSTVPDSGMTLAMLGAGLGALALFARSRKTA